LIIIINFQEEIIAYFIKLKERFFEYFQINHEIKNNKVLEDKYYIEFIKYLFNIIINEEEYYLNKLKIIKGNYLDLSCSLYWSNFVELKREFYIQTYKKFTDLWFNINFDYFLKKNLNIIVFDQIFKNINNNNFDFNTLKFEFENSNDINKLDINKKKYNIFKNEFCHDLFFNENDIGFQKNINLFEEEFLTQTKKKNDPYSFSNLNEKIETQSEVYSKLNDLIKSDRKSNHVNNSNFGFEFVNIGEKKSSVLDAENKKFELLKKKFDIPFNNKNDIKNNRVFH
jgi:hypothetical protein